MPNSGSGGGGGPNSGGLGGAGGSGIVIVRHVFRPQGIVILFR